MSFNFDFIVVGGGASGCVVASRLANSKAGPSVLLLEAGGANEDESYLIPEKRFTIAFTEEKLNWGYKTSPQTHLKGQEIDQSRGKGLGGSTAINFSGWVIGSDEDFNEWARIVGDDSWMWKNVKERFKKIENYHVDIPDMHKAYIHPKAEDHGTDGPLSLSYAKTWESGINDVFEAAEQRGMGINPDINSGNPIGMGMGASSMYEGRRTTASSYLRDAPSNLTVILHATVAKILLSDSGDTAVGVQTIDDRKFHANKEVILASGAINSPQLLMLSGLGPKEELTKHCIPILKDLPQVGKNLQDHCVTTATLLRRSDTDEHMVYESDDRAVALAPEQCAGDKRGMPSHLHSGVPMGFFKNDAVYNSLEFAALPPYIQEHLRKPSIPIFEIATHTPPLFLGDHILQSTDSYICALALVMNPQSRGEVTLNSPYPSDAPNIDPKFLAHPFDRRVAIESMRQMMHFLEAPVLKKNTIAMIGCPKSCSDEDIWEHWSSNALSCWHMCGTIRMGKSDDEKASLDTQFRVIGVKNLRVADLSVCPLLPNNHTQSTAYLVGETAAEKLIAEYKLDYNS